MCFLAFLEKFTFETVFEEEKLIFSEKFDFFKNNTYFQMIHKNHLTKLVYIMET